MSTRFTDAENTGIPAVPVIDTDCTPVDPRDDREEVVLSHRT